MIKQWRMEYSWNIGGVFTAIQKKDECYIKIIGPLLRSNPNSKAWYNIYLSDFGAILEITIKDDTEKSSGDYKKSSKSE